MCVLAARMPRPRSQGAVGGAGIQGASGPGWRASRRGPRAPAQAAGAESLQEFPPDCSLSRGNKASTEERAWEGARCSRCEERKPRAGRGVREDLGTRWGGLR